MQYDVFISYARKDYAEEQTKEVIPGNIVSRIKQLLDDNGLTYWFDETGIYSGDQFAGVIADAIEQSSIFLYISTEASNASKWTINEIATAKHLDKKIIPFRYDSSKYNKSILMYLAPLDHIDYPKSKDKAFGQLIVSIKTYKLKQERAEQEQQRAIELAKRREQEALEKQRQELEKQVRVREINQQLETLSSEIQKKKQEQASINIVLEGLEKRRTNLNNELAFLTGMATSYHPIEEEEEKVPDEDNAVTKEDESKKERSSVSFGDVWNKCISFASRNKMPLSVLLILGLLTGMLLLFWPNTPKYTAREMYLKADTLFHGYNGAQKDTLEAIKWYRKAAEKNDSAAQLQLGYFYECGIGVAADTAKSVELYRKSAESGFSIAQSNLGICYFYGRGKYVAKDTLQAIEWFRKAAENGKGWPRAQYHLGLIYENGYKVDKSEKLAIDWYRKAAEQGNELAKKALARLSALATGEINGHKYVDLGLSVKWATCNIGASSPSEYGDYYAWGETKTKKTYSIDNYLFYDTVNRLYINIGEDIAGSEYDAARAMWGSGWRMPTLMEFEELRDKCNFTFIVQNGVSGYRITGPSGKSIFLPNAGFLRTKPQLVGDRETSGCSYWSSTSFSNNLGFSYYLVPNEKDRISKFERFFGYPIRPVIK